MGAGEVRLLPFPLMNINELIAEAQWQLAINKGFATETSRELLQTVKRLKDALQKAASDGSACEKLARAALQEESDERKD